MKKILLALCAVLFVSAVFSQRLYFVYLQSEPAQPYFVRMNEVVHSSTASGYLILSRLRDSLYDINIGFPKNKWPEQKFRINIQGRDHGYSLRNFGDRGWGLYDLETMSIQMGEAAVAKRTNLADTGNVSPFTEMLSRAANDPALKEKPFRVKEEINKPGEGSETPKDSFVLAKRTEQTVSPPVLSDSSSMENKKEMPVQADSIAGQKAEIKEDVLSVKPKEDTVSMTATDVNAAVYHSSTVTKKSESSTTRGLELTYLDDWGNGKKDTIRILIPNPPRAVETKAPPKEEKKFLDISSNDTAKVVEPATKPVNRETQPARAISNNCSVFATESDFLKLRKRMASVKGNDEMVNEARKAFRLRCYSTQQVRNLGALFLDDEGKYKFFDAAYSHVTDPANFAGLGSEIKDEYYLNRFKAMLR